jgi:hypothetical protein
MYLPIWVDDFKEKKSEKQREDAFNLTPAINSIFCQSTPRTKWQAWWNMFAFSVGKTWKEKLGNRRKQQTEIQKMKTWKQKNKTKILGSEFRTVNFWGREDHVFSHCQQHFNSEKKSKEENGGFTKIFQSRSAGEKTVNFKLQLSTEIVEWIDE